MKYRKYTRTKCVRSIRSSKTTSENYGGEGTDIYPKTPEQIERDGLIHLIFKLEDALLAQLGGVSEHVPSQSVFEIRKRLLVFKEKYNYTGMQLAQYEKHLGMKSDS